MPFYKLDERNRPVEIPIEQWADLNKNEVSMSRRIAQSRFGKINITTVWWTVAQSPEHVFQTTVTGLPGGDEHYSYYPTRAAATRGHETAYDEIMQKLAASRQRCEEFSTA